MGDISPINARAYEAQSDIIPPSPVSPELTFTAPSTENVRTPPPLKPLHRSEFFPTIGPGMRSEDCSYCRLPIPHKDDPLAVSEATSVVHARCGHAYHRECLVHWMKTRPDKNVNPCFICGRRQRQRRSSISGGSTMSRQPDIMEPGVRESVLSFRSRAASLGGLDGLDDEAFRDFDGDFTANIRDSACAYEEEDITASRKRNPDIPKRSSSIHEFRDFDCDFSASHDEEEPYAKRVKPQLKTRNLTPSVRRSPGARNLNEYFNNDQNVFPKDHGRSNDGRSATFISVDQRSLVDEPISPILPKTGGLPAVGKPEPAHIYRGCDTVCHGQPLRKPIRGKRYPVQVTTGLKAPAATRPNLSRASATGYVECARKYTNNLPPEYISTIDDVEIGQVSSSHRRLNKGSCCWASSRSNKLSMALLAMLVVIVVGMVVLVSVLMTKNQH